jgi:hypothetical protein
MQGLVKTELDSKEFRLLRRGKRPQNVASDVTGCDFGDQKDDNGDEEHGQQHAQ